MTTIATTTEDVAPHAERFAALTDTLQRSERLRRRRFEMLPLRGAVSTDIQGRGPGPSVSPEGLADLVSSISSVGVLHPVLVEELEDADGGTRLRLVLGERRYRACRWGAVNEPDNPYFEALPAVICPGPLSVEERRTWQLVENLAREDLQPGELAAALLLERCAILQNNLEQAEIVVPENVPLLDDPVARFEALDKLRGTDVDLAAPWTLVLRRLGLQISPRRARELVAAFRTLPRELSTEMDEREVALAARTNLARLTRGRREVANELWQAVKRLGRTDLLTAAARAQAGDPAMSPQAAAEAASAVQDNANAVRAAKLTRPATSDDSNAEEEAQAGGNPAAARTPEPAERPTASTGPVPSPASPSVNDGADSVPGPEEPMPGAADAEPADAEIVKGALDAMRELNRQLTAGRVLHRFDAGSLRLLITDVFDQLQHRTI
ncbi:ParB N-terminal domain-containing protein [Streptacidiphilus jiangxiensis]|uniref:Chromosome partitioning protein, ParB family n=1 Tax=Streptacidiphilus jiangxiensis TaxID=235985 RepID=A0A1H8ANR6_STRJI|nr:ParB N-terminal domain-containing protein [Streptacidiphilus jiangxiensis]SEM72392.1 chromosome partitioning protein, ParB family [Streptacidiphilus jiangxiensis]